MVPPHYYDLKTTLLPHECLSTIPLYSFFLLLVPCSFVEALQLQPRGAPLSLQDLIFLVCFFLLVLAFTPFSPTIIIPVIRWALLSWIELGKILNGSSLSCHILVKFIRFQQCLMHLVVSSLCTRCFLGAIIGLTNQE